jgi:hypothetical protein
LWDVTDQEILAFAQQFGVLGLGQRELTRRDGDVACIEPTAIWRAYARGLRGFLSIGASLRRGQPVELEEWPVVIEAVLSQTDPNELRGEYGGRLASDFMVFGGLATIDAIEVRSLEGQRQFFSRFASDLLTTSGVRAALVLDETGWPRLGLAVPATANPWHGTKPVTWRVGSLAGVLLCATVDALQSEFVYRCSVCGEPYELPPESKKPRWDRRNFCSEECRRKAKREVQAASARRRYAARKVKSE